MSTLFPANSIAVIAALIGDPARANMLLALMGGKAMTAGELAQAASVSPQTASGHLAKLCDENLLSVEKQGRHRYFRLASPEVVEVLYSLKTAALKNSRKPLRTGPRDEALRLARICYDHLAGSLGVALSDTLFDQGHIHFEDGVPRVSESGREFFCGFGISLDTPSRRPLCRTCLDWSERRPHLGGQIGARLLARLLELGWVRQTPGSRALQITPKGQQGLRETFGLSSLYETTASVVDHDEGHWPFSVTTDQSSPQHIQKDDGQGRFKRTGRL